MTSPLEEHYGYLAIAGRAELYQAAITQTITPGDTIADLGCGVGVLGLQCLHAGASHIYGIDYTDAIELARETMQRAGLDDRYTAMRDSTFRAVLPEKVDALICDHVGFFGFDYGIIDMVRDARARMLKPGGAVIPRRIDPTIAGVSSESARELARQWSEADFPPEYKWLNTYARNTKHAHNIEAADLCSPAVAVASVALDAEGPELYSFKGTLEIARDCQFDGLAGWFNCELADGIWMTNSPLAEARIARSNVFLPCLEAFPVKAGDMVGISLRFTSAGDMIAWTVTPPGGKPQKMSTWNSRILTQADLAADEGKPPVLDRNGRARLAVLALVDGQRTAAEIEAQVLASQPDLFPTTDEASRFIRAELGRLGL
ncbi:methyltransferase domain-containing protein [Altererythrobacter lauratis]|uniref:Methyltransferase domain-containing protein n=1 Tax=Alteraurantiacibacter lauratis TaxID=2054627 RepID=A0ABV7EC60_9SPHN